MLQKPVVKQQKPIDHSVKPQVSQNQTPPAIIINTCVLLSCFGKAGRGRPGTGTKAGWIFFFFLLSVPNDEDRVRACIWRLGKEEKINQKINKTLKSLQSTEQDPAASFAQKDSLLLLLMGVTPHIQQTRLGAHLRGFHLAARRRQYSRGTARNILQTFLLDMM